MIIVKISTLILFGLLCVIPLLAFAKNVDDHIQKEKERQENALENQKILFYSQAFESRVKHCQTLMMFFINKWELTEKEQSEMLEQALDEFEKQPYKYTDIEYKCWEEIYLQKLFEWKIKQEKEGEKI